MRNPAAHGTLTRYRWDACRCDLCRAAMAQYHRANRIEKQDLIRQKDREYYERTREARLAYQVQYRVNNREKRNAQHRLQRAVKAGKIVRPETCSQCDAGGQIDAHHEDYAKPLDVVWLCESCHLTLHKNREAVGIGSRT